MELRSGKDSSDSSLHLKRLYVACEIVTLRQGDLCEALLLVLQYLLVGKQNDKAVRRYFFVVGIADANPCYPLTPRLFRKVLFSWSSFYSVRSVYLGNIDDFSRRRHRKLPDNVYTGDCGP